MITTVLLCLSVAQAQQPPEQVDAAMVVYEYAIIADTYRTALGEPVKHAFSEGHLFELPNEMEETEIRARLDQVLPFEVLGQARQFERMIIRSWAAEPSLAAGQVHIDASACGAHWAQPATPFGLVSLAIDNAISPGVCVLQTMGELPEGPGEGTVYEVESRGREAEAQLLALAKGDSVWARALYEHAEGERDLLALRWQDEWTDLDVVHFPGVFAFSERMRLPAGMKVSDRQLISMRSATIDSVVVTRVLDPASNSMRTWRLEQVTYEPKPSLDYEPVKLDDAAREALGEALWVDVVDAGGGEKQVKAVGGIARLTIAAVEGSDVSDTSVAYGRDATAKRDFIEVLYASDDSLVVVAALVASFRLSFPTRTVQAAKWGASHAPIVVAVGR